MHNNASHSHSPENILVRRVTQEVIERHFLSPFRLLNQAQPWHVEQHSYELPMEVKQSSTHSFNDDLSIDPSRSVEFAGDRDSNLKAPATGSNRHGQRRFSPRFTVNRCR